LEWAAGLEFLSMTSKAAVGFCPQKGGEEGNSKWSFRASALLPSTVSSGFSAKHEI